jgi:hypothetical protein
MVQVCGLRIGFLILQFSEVNRKAAGSSLHSIDLILGCMRERRPSLFCNFLSRMEVRQVATGYITP